MKYLLFLLLCLVPNWAWADHVLEQQARLVAQRHFKSHTRSQEVDLRLVYSGRTQTRSAQHPPFYVYDNASQGGFVVIAGEDCLMPIIAFSDQNHFSATQMPQNLQAWLDGMERQVAFAREQNLKPCPRVQQAWTRGEEHPIVVQHKTASWDQKTPFNNLEPIIPGTDRRAPVGCLITATAIVAKYHNWPDVGVGTVPAYTTEELHMEIPALKLGHRYDWANMANRYAWFEPDYTPQQAEAVAVLCRDLSYMLHADFTQSGTGAVPTEVRHVLTTYMKYSPEMVYMDRDHASSQQQWEDLMREDLSTNGPIIYGGYTAQYSGHAFVLDGFTEDGYFGVNWGYSGISNGYFKLSLLNMQGDQYVENGFNYGQNAIFKIRPNRDVQPDKGSPYDALMMEYDRTTHVLTLSQRDTPTPLRFDVRLVGADGVQLIQEQKGVERARFDLKGLSGGEYFLKIYDPNKGGEEQVKCSLKLPSLR